MSEFRTEFNASQINLILEKHWCDYWKLGFHLPELHIKEPGPYGECTARYAIRLPTEISFTYSYGFWSFGIHLLGFGVSLSRQYSY